MLSQRRIVHRILKIAVSLALIVFALKFSVLLFEKDDLSLSISSDLKKLMIDADVENSERLLTVKNVCQKYNLGLYKAADKASAFKHPLAPQYSVFYIDRIHRVSYCPIYKSGSTTWIYNLCLLMNVSEAELDSGKEQISVIARRAIPELEFPEADEALKVTRKLLVVRHPFERLLSAYRDKLENSVAGREHGTLHFYQKYGAKIVQKYREKNYTAPSEDQIVRREGVQPPAGIEPTFREFVLYLIHTDLASYGDDHWMPYYLFCTPCSLNYDIIAKVESLWRDQIYAINRLGLREKIKPRWKHSTGHSNASRIYFRQLNRKMLDDLYEKFRLDFELFGYSPEIYYPYVSPG